MIQTTIQIAGTDVILHGEAGAKACLVQLSSEYDIEHIGSEVAQIKELSGQEALAFAGLIIKDSNFALSPWSAPAVFKQGEDFGNGAAQTLSTILEKVLPEIERSLRLDHDTRYILGGYSFAALFALWAGYHTDKFYGVAAASPSVWFPKWDAFISDHVMQAKKVYLSLGDKEEKTRHPQMAKVAQRIRQQYDILTTQLGGSSCVLEWNQGNHFRDADLRKAKAFSWVINRLGE